jgi:hypothetical protein
MNTTTYGIVLEKLRISITVALFIGITLFALLGKRFFGSYMTGFLLGSLNLIMLSIELNIAISKGFGRIGAVHFVFFIVRYALIFLVIYRAISVKNSELFSLFGGLITVNLSIVLSAFLRSLNGRREV